MPNKAYNYDFRLYLEGVNTPFVSANIIATPNGVEANINLHADKTAYDLKPKTAVQIFYKDWVPLNGVYGWHLMFDGYLSGYIKDDQAEQGRALGISCCDFRMDIRKAPAALAYDKIEKLGVTHMYHRSGIKSKFVIPGTAKKPANDKGVAIRTFDSINDLSYMISLIAGTAFGRVKNNQSYDQKNGESQFEHGFGEIPEDGYNRGEGAFYLDAIVRGIWLEAVGGTSACAFMNKRIRADKKFMIPKNKTGFNFWKRSNAGIHTGTAMMGDAIFTSVEASIMRMAGMFLTRVYSCPTPSLINIQKEEVSEWVIHKDVKNFLIDRASAEFGAKYILNETMLLPPFEFTSPPNCNLILPPMYDRVNWQYNIDSDFTRGYFNVMDSFSTPTNDELTNISVQIPTALFQKTVYEGDEKDRYGRIKPPLTLEERYNGINVYYGSVQDEVARDDTVAQVRELLLTDPAKKKYAAELGKLIQKKNDIQNKAAKEGLESSLSKDNIALLEKRIEELQKIDDEKDRGKTHNMKEEVTYSVEDEKAKTKKIKRASAYAVERHALIKYLNLKYAGRVAVVDMVFNPYIMCGFPGVIVSDERGVGKNSTKTIIGMVQQVKHLILISSSGGNATTSAVLNNARFDDEPTDMDDQGNPLYMAATNPYGPTIGENGQVKPTYSIPEAKPAVRKQANDQFYDLDEREMDPKYIYAKDFLSLTDKDIANGERNNIYLDRSYEPNRISKFYDDVFNHNSTHFISGGVFTDASGEVIKYAFDTIHEGLDRLKKDHSNLMSEYEDCINYVRRNVCSADAFFQGILGLSRLKNGEYVNVQDDFKDNEIDDEYYGVTTTMFDSDAISGLKSKDPKNPGHMDGPGQFSSIREHMPITAFIYERHQLVKQYLAAVTKQIQGVQFANNDG